MKHRIVVVAMVLTAVVSWPGGAAAQGEDPMAALERGSELARQEKFDEAIGIWLSVLDKLGPEDQAAAQRKLGLAFKRTGRLPEAWHYLAAYLASPFGSGDETADGWLQEVQASLLKTHVKVTLSCKPEGLTLHIPTSSTGSANSSAFRIPHSEFVWWFEPGKHTVRAEAAGYEPRSVEVEIGASGGPARMEITLVGVAPVKETAGGSKIGGGSGGGIVVSKPAEGKKPSRAVEWTLIGSGLAMGAAGAIFHGLGYSRNEELDTEHLDKSKHPYGPDAKKAYDADFDDEVRPKEIAAYVLYGVGGAALVAGIITYAVRKPGGESTGSGPLTVVPLTLPGGGGAMMTLEW